MNIPKFCIKLTAMIFILTSLCGCYDYKDVSSRAYIIAIGIDKSKDSDLYSYTIQFARPVNFAGKGSQTKSSESETRKNKTPSVENIVVQAGTIYEAMQIIMENVAKTPYLGSLEILAVSEEIAAEGMWKIDDEFSGSFFVKTNFIPIVAKDSAKDFLENVKPSFEINPSKYYETFFQNAASPYVSNVNMQIFVSENRNLVGVCSIPYVFRGTMEDGESSPDATRDSPQQSVMNITGMKKIDDMINKSGEKMVKDSELSHKAADIGLAVFKNMKLKAVIPPHEILWYRAINHKENFEKFIYVSENIRSDEYSWDTDEENSGDQNKKISFYIDDAESEDVKISWVDGRPLISMKFNVKATSFLKLDREKRKKIEERLERSMYRDIMKILIKSAEEYEADVYDFGDIFFSGYLTIQDAERQNWREAYKNAAFSVDIDVNIRNTSRLFEL